MTTGAGLTTMSVLVSQGATSQFFQGNGEIEHVFNLAISPCNTKTVAVTYEPF
jgi:hypothetical protein